MFAILGPISRLVDVPDECSMPPVRLGRSRRLERKLEGLCRSIRRTALYVPLQPGGGQSAAPPGAELAQELRQPTQPVPGRLAAIDGGEPVELAGGSCQESSLLFEARRPGGPFEAAAFVRFAFVNPRQAEVSPAGWRFKPGDRRRDGDQQAQGDGPDSPSTNPGPRALDRRLVHCNSL